MVLTEFTSPKHQRQVIEDVILRAGVGSSLSSGDQVFLKPNLTYPRFSPGVTTRAEFVELVAVHFLDRGCRVTIGEGPGGYNGFSMRAALDAHGLTALGKRLGVPVVELSDWETEPLSVATKRGRPVEVPVSRKLRSEFDALISLPVPKVHCMTGVSLSLKNLWGCVPDGFRIRFHPYFDEIINALARALPVRGAVLDGMFGLDENGPMVDGVWRQLNWLGASAHCGSLDVAVASFLGFDPLMVSHLRYGMDIGAIPRPDQVEIVSTGLERRQFRLKRNLWNRIAALTWLHPRLTWLAYLSPLSGPIHWAMYRIRKRPDDLAVRGLRGWEAPTTEHHDMRGS